MAGQVEDRVLGRRPSAGVLGGQREDERRRRGRTVDGPGPRERVEDRDGARAVLAQVAVEVGVRMGGQHVVVVRQERRPQRQCLLERRLVLAVDSTSDAAVR